MFFSSSFVQRINLIRFVDRRFVQTSMKIELQRLNRLKLKDLQEIFDDEQRKIFFQLKKSSGGKFHSIEQIKMNPIFKKNLDQFNSFLSKINDKSSSDQHRIHIEPRLNSKNIFEIDDVLTVDYNSSFLNYSLIRLNSSTNRSEVKEWNSIEIHFDRKFHFLRTFHQLKEILQQIPFEQSKTILLEENHYRLTNIQLASFINRLQQIRCVLNTIIHLTRSNEKIFHISSRDVSLHFGLFVGNEQSSSEFHLTNLIFDKEPNLDISDEFKTKFYQTNEGQRESMAQCLLRSFAFLQLVQQKRLINKRIDS